MFRISSLTAALSLTIGFAPSAALAQVPPHTPGSICFTPNFWCWIDPPGPPGHSCYCYDSSGTPVSGYLN